MGNGGEGMRKKNNWLSWGICFAFCAGIAGSTFLFSGCGKQMKTETAGKQETTEESRKETDTEEKGWEETPAQTERTKEASSQETAGSKESSSEGEQSPYLSYLGYWENKDKHCSLDIVSIQGDRVLFLWNVSNGKDRTAEVGETVGILEGNRVAFEFTDSWENQGTGELTLGDRQIRIESTITEEASGARFCAAVEADLFRAGSGEDDSYLFYDSNVRYLTKDEVGSLSKEEMRLARNEIFARHGRQFSDEDLAAYFEGKSWYTGSVDPEIFDQGQESLLNEYEKANVALILEMEEE